MKSQLDFTSTQSIRDRLLSYNISSGKKPQETVLNVFPNTIGGGVTIDREEQLKRVKTFNSYHPENFEIIENLQALKSKYSLKLYPYFIQSRNNTLINVINKTDYENESFLYKVSQIAITEGKNSVVNTRSEQFKNGELFYNKITVNGEESRNFLNILNENETSYTKIGEGYDNSFFNPLNFSNRDLSELYITYSGKKQRETLYNLLSLSKYSPYGGFSYIEKSALDSINNVYGNKMGSPYYLSLFFDPVAANLFHNEKIYDEGLMWISKRNSVNGYNKASTNYGFREGSILFKTQQLIDSYGQNSPIDQTVKFFRDGDTLISRGSAVRQITVDNNDKRTGEEFSRVWTKNNPYKKYKNLIRNHRSAYSKRSGMVFKTPYDLSIFPKRESTKNYMFSIENLAWRSEKDKLPAIEIGPNNGRIMWFPPYGLKVNEQNSASWDENFIIGRPEPIYTYKQTSRGGSISFKIVVDHPSIINKIIPLDKITDEDIRSFFSQFKDYSEFERIKQFPTLSEEQSKIVDQYLKKNNIDVDLKTIYQKILFSEELYFKELEETDSFVYESLKEKLKFFHPSFHSTTPEGLNSRMTFLQQCIRPGNTIPIKNEDNNYTVKNTTFGSAPVCILRIGDFYHSKVIIRDVNFTYEDNVWDLNPEGIGIQPIIVDVQLQLYFIGGQGLEKPVEELQNALSFNFYANTELYNTTFVDNFRVVEESIGQTSTKPIESAEPNNSYVIGEYFGEINDNQMSYNKLFNQTIEHLNNFYNVHNSMFNNYYNRYGDRIHGIFFNMLYRSKITFIYEIDNNTKEFSILGDYDDVTDVMIKKKFKDDLIKYGNDYSISDVIGLPINDTSKTKSNETLKKIFSQQLDIIFEEIGIDIKDLIILRNKFLVNMLKLLFILTNGKDVEKNNNGQYIIQTISGDFINFNKHINDIIYFIINNNFTYSNINTETSYNFYTGTLDHFLYKEFIKQLLSEKRDLIIKEYKKDMGSGIETVTTELFKYLTKTEPKQDFFVGFKSFSTPLEDLTFTYSQYTGNQISIKQDIDDIFNEKITLIKI